MVITSKPKKFDGNEIIIDSYHVIQLGLISNTKIWMTFYPKQNFNDFSELVLSPVDFRRLEYLWKIQISLFDSINVIKELLEVLKNTNVNILNCESTYSSKNQIRNLDIIIDTSSYQEYSFNGDNLKEYSDSDLRLLNDLKKRILSQFIEKLVFVKEMPSLHISRISGFKKGFSGFVKVGNSILKQGEKSNLSKFSKRLELSNPIKEAINSDEYFVSNNKLILNEVYYFSSSNSDDKFLKVFFYTKNDKILFFSFRHLNSVNSLKLIISAIRKEKFHIIASTSKHVENKQSLSDFIVRHSDKDKHTISALKIKLEMSLSTEEIVTTINPEIKFLHEDTSNDKWKRLIIHKRSELNTDNVHNVEIELEKLFLKYNSLPNEKMSDREKRIFLELTELISGGNASDRKKEYNDSNTEFKERKNESPKDFNLAEKLDEIIINISNGKTESGLEKLLGLTTGINSEFKNDVILLNNKSNRIKRSFNRQIISNEEYMTELIKIASSMLNLVDSIKKEIL